MEKNLHQLIQKYQRLLKHGERNVELADKNDPEAFPKCQPVLNSVWKIIIKDLQGLADKVVDDQPKDK